MQHGWERNVSVILKHYWRTIGVGLKSLTMRVPAKQIYVLRPVDLQMQAEGKGGMKTLRSVSLQLHDHSFNHTSMSPSPLEANDHTSTEDPNSLALKSFAHILSNSPNLAHLELSASLPCPPISHIFLSLSNAPDQSLISLNISIPLDITSADVALAKLLASPSARGMRSLRIVDPLSPSMMVTTGDNGVGILTWFNHSFGTGPSNGISPERLPDMTFLSNLTLSVPRDRRSIAPTVLSSTPLSPQIWSSPFPTFLSTVTRTLSHLSLTGGCIGDSEFEQIMDILSVENGVLETLKVNVYAFRVRTLFSLGKVGSLKEVSIEYLWIGGEEGKAGTASSVVSLRLPQALISVA
jgi:hypothetical protein